MRRLIPLVLLFASAVAGARVVSYAPYTNRVAAPAVQHRLNRHFVLVEYPQGLYYSAQAVLYDARGEEEPRVIYPASGIAAIYAAAVREDEAGMAIFLQTGNSSGALSVDRGATWKTFVLPTTASLTNPWAATPETGGAYVHARGGPLRVGTAEVPFAFATAKGLYGITAGGEVKTLLSMPLSLLGSSRDGAKFLVLIGTLAGSVDTAGNFGFIGYLPSTDYIPFEGWITPGGGAYIERISNEQLYYIDRGVTKSVSGPMTFAVPSADYAGAWIVNRDTKTTTLAFHSPAAGLTSQWTDAAAPEVEALYPGQSGKTVLVQVHRPRLALDQSLLKDPALAVWHVGDPAPPGYDELFMAETGSKSFVHVDADAVENGEPFVFDSGIAIPPQVVPSPPPPGPPAPPPPPSAGGSDVVQEWGVVRASLAQRLVLPGMAHAPGAGHSFWRSDVTFYNPSGVTVHVTVRYSTDGRETTLALAPGEIRTVADVLQTLFGVDSGGGALFLTPERGTALNATARTYTESPLGTLGYAMNAIDAFAAFRPRFPATFSGALLGASYRTNLVLTDVSGRTTDATVTAWSASSTRSGSFSTPALGQKQVNRLGDMFDLPAANAALVVEPTSGEALVGAVAIDNLTNDATYFPPDIATSAVRMFPAVGHVDGANGTHFRTDVYVFNNSDEIRTLYLQPTLWNGTPIPFQWFTMQPHEVRVFSDVLFETFHRSGMARMRVWSGGATSDVSLRATARTYTVDENGGTAGFFMPPLNSFQSGAAGDTLEILGTSLQKNFRTNLGLVDTTRCDSCGVKSHARVDVVDSHGATIDSFETDVPAAGAMQINDLFHARNLADSGEPVLIRVTVLNGMLGAYGAMVDNGTNDPAYFAANLASKQ
jgi:hypothetical protein